MSSSAENPGDPRNGGTDWDDWEEEFTDARPRREGDASGEAGDVVDLGTARGRRADRAGDPAPDAEDNLDPDDEVDQETADDSPPEVGPPVDPVDEVPPSVRGSGERRPVIPEWARSRADLYVTARRKLRDVGYVTAYHGVRSPKYAGKAAVWAPVGLFRMVGRLIKWATAEEGNWALRQYAADRNDPDTWLRLDTQRQRQASWRWWVALPALMAIVGGIGILASGELPAVAVAAAVAVLVPVLAWYGSPADSRITDRVTEQKTYRKLTAELVRRGLLSLGLAGINQAVAKDPGAISFPTEIHRDGPGHLALVDLPYGVVATDVIKRRDRLASGLRLPLDQVWPETDRTHTGRLALFVGYEPASAMPVPSWPLLKTGTVDVFQPFPFAHDPRLRACNAPMIQRNWLVGGQPGSGKTFVLRLLVLGAALDPRVELRGYEMKGTRDFAAVEPICTEYGNGFDDETIARAAGLMSWLVEECERRTERIGFYAAKGMSDENKITPELASLKGSGLHPLVVFFDEVQNLFMHATYGKEAGLNADMVIRMGRAVGITVLMGTQVPDASAIPPAVTRNVNTRFCMSVDTQLANDMILGTSQYKAGYRATVFEPEVDSGWGIARGLGKTAAYKSYYVDNPTAKRVAERAIAARREAGTLPEAPEVRETGPAYDVLTDVAEVWPAGESAAWSETLIERLTELRPEVYEGWKPGQLAAALAVYGIRSEQIGRRVDGKTKNLRGPSYEAIVLAITERSRKRAQEDTA